MTVTPAYLRLLEDGRLEDRAALALEKLRLCTLCPWTCRKDRLAGQKGICRTAAEARVSSFGPHMGEERPLSGRNGSGTIFFSSCSLRCQYCQNHEISQTEAGEAVSAQDLAKRMLSLQEMGCHNINLVTPTHVVPQILAALCSAADAGLRLPLVYNSGGFDNVETLRLLDGVVDIYLPDMKYSSARIAQSYSRVRDYPEINRAAVREMYRQVGDLQIGSDGLAQRGLLVRHLVLPDGMAGSREIIDFLAREISPDTYLNVMDQYRPAFNAARFPRLNRRVSAAEVEAVREMALSAGLQRLDPG